MVKFNTLQEYIDTFNEDALNCYNQICEIMNFVDLAVKQRLFAGQVAFYVEKNLNKTFHSSPVIVMSFFKDHVNIFAKANINYINLLKEYKFTQKGTLQILYSNTLVEEVLVNLFSESLQ